MKLRFLCGAHRVALADKPGQAIHCWQNGFDTGQSLYDQHLWEDALPHLGCAFETSEIILTTGAIAPGQACELFVSSALLLADSFEKLGYAEQSQTVYRMTINRLERELSRHTVANASIKQHLENLYGQVKYQSPTDAAAAPAALAVVH